MEASKTNQLTVIDPVAQSVNGRQFVALPHGYFAKSLEEFEPQPWRTRRNVLFYTPADFIAYVKRFAEAGSCVYVTTQEHHAQAIFDDHSPQAPRWTDHRATFGAQYTIEYAAWLKMLDKPILQKDLAIFLEDRQRDLEDPRGSDLLELVTRFKATQAATFRSEHVMRNGDVSFEYTTTTSGGNGTLEVPEVLELGVNMFCGQLGSASISVRLRYKLSEGKLHFRLQIPNREELEQKTFERLVMAKIIGELGTAEGGHGLPFFEVAGPPD